MSENIAKEIFAGKTDVFLSHFEETLTWMLGLIAIEKARRKHEAAEEK